MSLILTMSKRFNQNGRIYSRYGLQRSTKNIKKFKFDQKVVNAFPDMIYRSVPGYRTIINYCGSISSKYIKEDSNCYDLGCSLGASTLSIIECNRDTPFCLHAVDNSVEMIKRLEKIVAESKEERVICT